MANINLIISGNLTGYAHFYATPSAYDIYNEDKLEFDYRNYLTFLLDGDKAYAISFGRNVVAVSLVVRSLDSFRRPGIIVFTVLMHRREKIVSSLDPKSGRGMLDLLSEVHDRFMMHNFVNGVLNQNLTILKQDYYSEILNNYQVVPDTGQRNINSTLDFAATTKQIGYVVPENGDIAPYLETPCRQSYTRYHHVFLANNAPANISETAQETILYTITIKNNGQRISGVRLVDKIAKLSPGEFESPIETDFTYKQVLEGQAPKIRMAANGDGYDITYNFPKLSKQVEFKCMLNGKEIPFQDIELSCEDPDGSSLPITLNPFVFEGKELRDTKTLRISSANYGIKSGYEKLNLSRCKDNEVFVVQLENVQMFRLDFSSYALAKKVILTKGNDRRVYDNVLSNVTITITGRPEEWSYRIESEFYETCSGRLFKEGEVFDWNLVKKVPKSPDLKATAGASTLHAKVSSGGKGGQLFVSGGDSFQPIEPEKPRKNKKKFVLIGIVVAIICIVVMILCFRACRRSSNQENPSCDTSFVPVIDTLSVKLNYDYNKFKSEDFTLTVSCDSILFTEHQVKGSDSVGAEVSIRPDDSLQVTVSATFKGCPILSESVIDVKYGKLDVQLDVKDRVSHIKDSIKYVRDAELEAQIWNKIQQLMKTKHKIPLSGDYEKLNRTHKDEVRKYNNSLPNSSATPVQEGGGPAVKRDVTLTPQQVNNCKDLNKYKKITLVTNDGASAEEYRQAKKKVDSHNNNLPK